MSEYSKVTPEIVEQIKAVVAPNRVYTGADINEDFSHDEMSIYGKAMPELVVDAVSTEEIAATMKIAYDNNIPVTARGAGTGLVGACVPIAGGIVINTTKMNKILEYDLNNFVVKVQCGVLLNDLAEDCVSKGLMYPPDPGEKFATLGGNVSTNAGGMRACKYGATRDYVRAMEVVLPTGEVTRFGSTVSKTSSGYSLLNLMIGSEGTLGIITELTLKVIPAPKEVISLVIPFETLADCIGTVPQFKKNGLDPQALEFMEKAIVQASERYIGKSVYPQKIDGVEATVDNVSNDSYKIARPFNILTSDKESDAAKDFVNYIMSSDGQKIVEDNGYIKEAADAKAYEAADGVSGKVVVAGSSSVTPVMEKLAEGYEAVNKDVTVEVQQSDSTTGVNMAAEGTADIGMASRDLKDEEKDLGLTATVIARDGIAVIVNKDNDVDELTSDQVKAVYTGETTTWEDLAK